MTYLALFRNPLPCGRGSDAAGQTFDSLRQSRDRKGAGSGSLHFGRAREIGLD